MHVMICSVKRCRQWIILAATVLAGGLLLCYPQAAATGIRHGLNVCGQLLIPSLFPFMVLSGFIIRSGLANSIGRHLSGVMARLFGLSGCASVALLISMLGGYPAGASAVTQLAASNLIDRKEAQRLLCCCVNAGPAFIIGGVGVGMLRSAKAGLLLLIAHWVSSLLIVLCHRKRTPPAAVTAVPRTDIGTAVTDSVNSACRSLIAMGGFVLLASTAVSLTDALGGAATAVSPIRTVFTCLLEVSTGCMNAAALPAAAPFIIGATLGFGGLSVHGQIAAQTAAHRLITKSFFTTRLLHALLGGCFSALLFRFGDPYEGVYPAVAALSSVTRSSDGTAMAGLLAMITMCILFLSSLNRHET